MNNNTIVRLKNVLYKFYYSEDKNICFRKYENNKLGKEEVVLENALPDFTVTIKDNKPEVFSRDVKGNIVLSTYNGNNFSNQIMLENKSEQIHKILFSSLRGDNSMNLIYNIPDGQKYYKLMSQNYSESSKWEKAVEIDTFQCMKDNLYYVNPVEDNKSLICYVDSQNNLGYRLITPNDFGEFEVLIQNGEQVLDFSIMKEGDNVHFLYIIGNIFTYRLMYRRKSEGETTKPLILWEGNRIDNCLIWIENNNLNASYILNNKLYVQKSTNMGDSFYQSEIYKNKFCFKPIKAAYITNLEMDRSDFYINEIYVDAYNPWDEQILPDLSNNFYPFENMVKNTAQETQIPTIEIKKEEPKIVSQDIITKRLNAVDAENQELRYKHAQIKEELEQKNQFISSLNYKMEIEKSNYEKQITGLKNDIEILRKNNELRSKKKVNVNTSKNNNNKSNNKNNNPQNPAVSKSHEVVDHDSDEKEDKKFYTNSVTITPVENIEDDNAQIEEEKE